MRVAAAYFPDIGRTGAWRLFVTFLLLFAFALQSYVTQTHVHRAPVAAERASVADVVGKASANSVSQDDQEFVCPFCQAIAAAGAFVGPPAIALDLPAVQAEATARRPMVVGLLIASAGFNWRSRAPPHS